MGVKELLKVTMENVGDSYLKVDFHLSEIDFSIDFSAISQTQRRKIAENLRKIADFMIHGPEGDSKSL